MNINMTQIKQYATRLPKWAIGIAGGLVLGLTVVVLDQKGVFKNTAENWRLNRELKAGPLSGINPDRVSSVRIVKWVPGKGPDVKSISDKTVVRDIVNALASVKPSGIAAGTNASIQLVLVEDTGKTKSVRMNEFVVRENSATSALAAQWETPEALRKIVR